MPKSRIAGSYGKLILSLLSTLQIICHSQHSHQWWMRACFIIEPNSMSLYFRIPEIMDGTLCLSSQELIG